MRHLEHHIFPEDIIALFQAILGKGWNQGEGAQEVLHSQVHRGELVQKAGLQTQDRPCLRWVMFNNNTVLGVYVPYYNPRSRR